MKLSLAILATLAVAAAAVFASLHLLDASASPSKTAKTKPCGPDAVAQYGHVKALTKKGDHYEVRFDPAWFLSGVTASRAALEDTGSSDVPNDNYVVEEGHRLLTYLVPETAHITVLTKSGKPDSRGFPSTSITWTRVPGMI